MDFVRSKAETDKCIRDYRDYNYMLEDVIFISTKMRCLGICIYPNTSVVSFVECLEITQQVIMQ
jgi:hypothetical protein